MISLHQISKKYATAAGFFTALAEVDLDIDRGECVAIVGKSGSGKSTLLNMMGGIDRPTQGAIKVDGTSLVGLKESRLAAWRGLNVGFVFQFFQLLPTLTAAENVTLPMEFCGTLPAGGRKAKALELLSRVGVADQADKLPAALSGGQQQRVAIARALANHPPVVLADEPTGNLDSTTAREVLDLFRALADGGTTVVIATHETDIARVANRTVSISDGRLC